MHKIWFESPMVRDNLEDRNIDGRKLKCILGKKDVNWIHLPWLGTGGRLKNMVMYLQVP